MVFDKQGELESLTVVVPPPLLLEEGEGVGLLARLEPLQTTEGARLPAFMVIQVGCGAGIPLVEIRVWGRLFWEPHALMPLSKPNNPR